MHKTHYIHFLRLCQPWADLEDKAGGQGRAANARVEAPSEIGRGRECSPPHSGRGLFPLPRKFLIFSSRNGRVFVDSGAKFGFSCD